MPRVYVKTPTAVLDYPFNWNDLTEPDGPYLAVGETITASTWTAETGLTIQSSSFTTTTTTVWLSGGTAGTLYLVTNHITTSAGRQDDRSILIDCEEPRKL